MSDFIYEKQISPSGIAVEEIYGAENKSAAVWKLFAMQIFSEADGDYRSIEHLANGAPVLDGVDKRISVSHTSHHLAVASLPKTPDIDLSEVNVRTAVGIDIEKADRSQVLRVAPRFLSADEENLFQPLTAQDDADAETVMPYVLAWTCKEALYKAVMGIAPDWKDDYRILSLPVVASNLKSASADKYGKAVVSIPGSAPMDFILSSWQWAGHIFTLAFTAKIPRYH